MAPTRIEFEVVPTGTEWEIKRDGQEFLSVQSKDVAVDEAVFQAARSEPSHIVVRRLDGSTENEAEFGDPSAQPAAPPDPYQQNGSLDPFSSGQHGRPGRRRARG